LTLSWLEQDFVAEKKVGEDLLSFAQEHLNPGTLNLIKLKFLHVRG
jgi:hypothetical protein